MNKTVTIACDEQGQYSVGEQPPLDEGADMDGGIGRPGMDLQPVESLDAALDMARQLLSEEDPARAENQGAFEKGFQKASASSGLDQYIKRG